MNNIARTLLLTLLIAAACNAVSAIAHHYPIPYVHALLEANSHLAFFTLAAVTASLLTGQKTLAVIVFAAILLCSASSPGFAIVNVLYPTTAGLFLGLLLRGVILDNQPPPPPVQPPPVQAPPPEQPPREGPPRQHAPRRGTYDHT